MADYGREHVLLYMGHWLPIGATLPNYKIYVYISILTNRYRQTDQQRMQSLQRICLMVRVEPKMSQKSISAHVLANKEKTENNQHHQLIRLPLRSQWKLCRSCLPWSLPDP